jgi:beta-glucanase (GH16 family)
MKKITLFFIFTFFACTAFAQYIGYTLVWSDEFNGGYTNTDSETGLDMSSWSFETGNGDWGWGTGQRDYATTDLENVEVSGGTLKIRTQRNHANQTQEYTSGRLNSKDKRSFTFGKIEARIRTIDMTESGRGFAFWLMPDGLYNGTTELMWPQGGEIDIFEYNGLYPQYNLGSVHHAWKWNNNLWGGDGNHAHSGSIYNPLDRDFQYRNVGRGCGNDNMTTGKTTLLGAEWHTYGINWFDDRIEFYVDQDVYHVFYYYDESWCGEHQTNSLGNHQNKAGFDFNKIEEDNGEWQSHGSNWRPFENPFYIILSAGVGGADTYGGNITAGNNPNQWTCTTEIDWVRVYEQCEDCNDSDDDDDGNGTNIYNTAYNKIQVYVNNNELVVSGQWSVVNDLKIFDITGKVVLTNHLPLTTNHSINISGLASGVYLLKIDNQVVKFIKK